MFDGDATHIANLKSLQWKHGPRIFGDATRTVCLTISEGEASFTKILDIDVFGSAYGLPPLADSDVAEGVLYSESQSNESDESDELGALDEWDDGNTV